MNSSLYLPLEIITIILEYVGIIKKKWENMLI